ncbi:MAG: CvpA family protein [Candidatus Aerophobetes bacterium]|nr:CvpA family protein [Candidatus Aerophobetes bacterium]
MRLNWLDIVIIMLVVLFMIRGAMKGLFREAFGLGGVFLGIIIAINRYEGVAEVLMREFNKSSTISPTMTNIISFIIIFIGIALLCSLIGVTLHKASKYSLVKGLDQGGGFLLGLFEGSLICSLILILLSISPLSEKASEWTGNSLFSPYLIKGAPVVYDRVVSIVPGKAKKFMEKLNKFEELAPGKSKGK